MANLNWDSEAEICQTKMESSVKKIFCDNKHPDYKKFKARFTHFNRRIKLCNPTISFLQIVKLD